MLKLIFVTVHHGKRKSLLETYLSESEVARAKWQNIKNNAAPILISGYDITKKCNLRCEGCFFFEGELSSKYDEKTELTDYRQFFRSEQQRGINYPHFAGAEPALVQERLRVAAEVWQRGLVYTNGTRPIAREIPFMLHVSVWGNDATDRHLRGASVLQQAIANYQGDPRVVFVYTINRLNIEHLHEVTETLAAAGLKLTFNHYSPSIVYQQKINAPSSEKTKTFRFSDSSENLILTEADLEKIKEDIKKLKKRFSDTIIYSDYYNEFINQPDIPWKINPETGRAANCPILNKPYHRQYHTDFSYSDDECCIANIDCNHCRHYVAGYTKVMNDLRPHMKSQAAFEKWLDVYDTWCKLHIVGWPDIKDGPEASERK